MKHTQDIEIDLSKYSITEEEILENRKETYRIFKDTMIEFNPEISEDKIKELFVVKFGYLPY
jgi:hypothetical protein